MALSYGDYPDLSNVRKILVVKLRHLGDVLLTGPVFTALKQALPSAQIDAYIYREAIPMLEGHPDIESLIGYDRGWKKRGFFSRMGREIGILRQIRREGYDLIVNLTEGDRGIFAALASGAKICVGFAPKGGWQKKVLTHIAKECPTPRHTVERNLDALRRIGIFPSEEARELFFHIPDSAKGASEALAPYVLIHPTSRWRFKCWPVPKMRELVGKLLAEGKRVVLTSGPDPIERQMLQEIGEGMDVLNLGGRVSLKELGALIDKAELLVSVDSVPFHIASALKRPVVALFGPTSEVTWGPWRNPQAKIVSLKMSCRPCYLDGCGGSKRSDCLESISVEAVLKAVHSHILKSSPK